MQLEEIPVALRMQPKLSFQSEIIYVNTAEDDRLKREQDYEANEKGRLKNEISRLKKIIRDMQIEKIRSIDNEADLGESSLRGIDSRARGIDSRALHKEETRV